MSYWGNICLFYYMIKRLEKVSELFSFYVANNRRYE